jgi:hypothetical protein
MAWFKDHYFLCAWIALPFTLWNAISRLRVKGATGVDWTWSIIVLTFGITLGIAFTPAFDQFSRDYAKWMSTLSFMTILFNRSRS